MFSEFFNLFNSLEQFDFDLNKFIRCKKKERSNKKANNEAKMSSLIQKRLHKSIQNNAAETFQSNFLSLFNPIGLQLIIVITCEHRATVTYNKS